MRFKQHISLRSLFWMVVFVGTGIICIAAMRHKSDGMIQGARVEIQSMEAGNHLLTSGDILSELEDILGPVENFPVKSLDLHELEDILYYNPFVKDVNVFISGENALHVIIEERQPILRIIEQNGESYYLDISGIQIPTSPHFTARVAVANGLIPAFDPEAGIGEQKTFSDLYALIQTIHRDKFLRALIEQIYVDEKHEYVLIPKIGKERIRFGDISRLEDKLENLKIFYCEALPKEGWGKYREINLKYQNQVVCTKNKTTS